MREEAYRRLREAIFYGKLRPGERLVEVDICRTFDVGRTPLREALRQLQMEGFLDVTANKGAVVRKISPDEMESIYDVIALLESYAAREATKRLVSIDAGQELVKIQNQLLLSAESSDDFMEWLDKNYEFHQYFVRHSGNDYLRAAAEDARAKIYRGRFAGINSPGDMKAHFSAHEAIIHAVVNGDTE